MADINLYKSELKGKVTVCSSKSVAHRAVIVGALSGNDLTIKNVDYSKDIEATIEAVKALGVDISYKNREVLIKKSKIKRNSEASFNATESGSTLRFLIPVFVALGNKSTFSGEGRLPKRPLDDYLEIFKENKIEFKKDKDYLPLFVNGSFSKNVFNVRGDVSSQFITGLMLSGIVREEEITINITTNLESKPYVDITKKVLEDFGHKVYFKDNVIKVKKGSKDIREFTVDSDWSQAAFFLAGGAVSGDVTVEDMNLSSTQGDKEIVDILEKMGANVTASENCVNVKKSSLEGIEIDVSQIPDLVPILAVLGACAKGETLLYNAKRLRLKESDRLVSTKEMLECFGVDLKIGDDYIKIKGGFGSLSNPVDSFNDHRIVMSASVMATNFSKTTIKNYKAVEKSYPGFFKDFFKIGGKGEIINE